ncbi:MAG TPA: hypothetical protein VMF06_19400 [Candidatus Limnocylindria bacterium]|jgi:hypothetical protein|nr:hypothetical protein [Candidatus Limnocylindria bacterium]
MDTPKQHRRPRWKAAGLRCLKLIGGLVCLLLVAWCYENWRGKRDWAALKKEYGAQGIALEFADWERMRSKEKWDENTFPGAPLLVKAMTEIRDERRRKTGVSQENVSPKDATVAGGKTSRWINQDDLARFKRDSFDLSYWKAALAGDDYEPGASYDRKSAAKEILASLNSWSSELEGLDGASRHPDQLAAYLASSRSPNRDGFAEHLFPQISQILTLRCVVKLELDDMIGALADFETNERLAQALLAGNGESCNHTGQRMMAFGARMAWEGLNRHRWSLEQLEQIERVMLARNHRASWLEATKSDLWQLYEAQSGVPGHFHFLDVLGNVFEVVEYWPTAGSGICRELMDGNIGWEQAGEQLWDYTVATTGRLGELAESCATACCEGYRYRKLIAEMRLRERDFAICETWVKKDVAVNAVNFGESLDRIKSGRASEGEWLFCASLLDSDMLTVAGFENMTSMARIACALEKSRIKTGRCPLNLESVELEYPGGFSHDAFGGAVFDYASVGQSVYRLKSSWSRYGGSAVFTSWPTGEEVSVWPGTSIRGARMADCGNTTWLDTRMMRE